MRRTAVLLHRLTFADAAAGSLRFAPAELQYSAATLLRRGWVQRAYAGAYHLLPPARRCVEKLERLIDRHLAGIGAHKIALTTLTPTDLWERSGRLENYREIFTLHDRSKESLCLGPTYEEAITLLFARLQSHAVPEPLRYYQTTVKFRDEVRPRNGLLRAREFIMNDLYTVDLDESSALHTYEEVTRIYDAIFTQLFGSGGFSRVRGESGEMGGSLSHEYLAPGPSGEANIVTCGSCGAVSSDDVCPRSPTDDSLLCDACGSDGVVRQQAIELAHQFFLGDTYSSTFGLLTRSGSPAMMCCAGIGVTRLVAALAEEKRQLHPSIAPYSVGIVPQKYGHAFETSLGRAEELYDALASVLPGDVLIDTRHNVSIGRRLNEMSDWSIPIRVAVGKSALEEVPKFEVLMAGAEPRMLSLEQTVDFIKEFKANVVL